MLVLLLSLSLINGGSSNRKMARCPGVKGSAVLLVMAISLLAFSVRAEEFISYEASSVGRIVGDSLNLHGTSPQIFVSHSRDHRL